MSDNFERIPENLADPSRVRNFLKDAQNDAQRKQYSLVFHIVYALLCALVVFFALGGSPLLLVLAPAMCVFTFLYSPMYLKITPVALPLIAFLVKNALGGFKTDFFSVCQALFVYLLCILSAALITKAVISGYTKTTLFVTLSTVFGIIAVCQIMFGFIASVGTFSFSLLLDTIDKFFESIVNQSVAISQSPEGLEMFRSLAVSGKELTDAEITELVKDSVEGAVGLYMLRNGVDPKDSETVAARAHEAQVDIRYVDGSQHVYLCGEDVSLAIRENEVSAAASGVSAVPLVRRILVARQQE
ncbi:MAG: (d)CMP kinase, partial [Clostridia bacterium]|nr:(d)CMP kinase [Clostridia bacterium]